MSALLEIQQLQQSYNGRDVLVDVNLQVQQGQTACLLGPSGCGKTTLLRVVAGFEQLNQGKVLLAGECVNSAEQHLSPELRNIGMVFQDYALFPHLSVWQNICFGLKKNQINKSEIEQLLELVELNGLEKRYPHQLSGGQQQRVALARALAPKPRLLLLDEPFSNLDVHLRERLAADLRRLLRRQGTTALMVTHDQNEAFAFADQVGVMNQGRIEQCGSAEQLYQQPATAFVADFIGEGMVFDCQQPKQLALLQALGLTPSNDFVLLRPDRIAVQAAGMSNKGVEATLCSSVYRAGYYLCSACLDDGQEILFYSASDLSQQINQIISLTAVPLSEAVSA